jgi:hypothetical protein
MAGQADNSGDRFLALTDEALVRQCEVDHYRSHGPGGQKHNKRTSAVRLRHRPTGLIVTAADNRSQPVNRVRAIKRLREAIALHVRAEVDLDEYRPSELLAGCITGDGQIRVKKGSERYFEAISEILDVLSACGMGVRDAAGHISISTAHLVQFIERDPKLWERVNQMRQTAGLKPLR